MSIIQKHMFTFIIGISLIVVLLVPVTNGQSNTSNVTLHLSGPSVLGTLRSGTYSATFVDSESRNWDYKVFISSSNTSGASPLIDSPINGTITPGNRSFTFTITAQQSPGDLEIHVNCTTGTLYYEKVQKISVVTPIALNFDVNNPTNVEILNATIQFYVDGLEIDKQIVPSFKPNQITQVSSEWITKDKTPGWHDARIVIDLNGDGVIDTNAGDKIINDRFYIEGETNWVFGLTVLVGLFILIIGLGYISKRKIK